jgi:thioesterase domain-containing protein
MDSESLLARFKRFFTDRPVSSPGAPRARTNAAPAGPGDAFLEERIRIYEDATQKYDPLIRPYPGRVVLFRATGRTDFAGDEVTNDLGWGGLIPKLDVRTVAGGHIDMLKTPYVATLAASLRPLLAQCMANETVRPLVPVADAPEGMPC